MRDLGHSGVGWCSCSGRISRLPASSILAVATILSGCCNKPPIIKPVPVEVTKYVKVQIPEALLKRCEYSEPSGACWRDGRRALCNGQLVSIIADYKAALALCDSQVQAIGKINGASS